MKFTAVNESLSKQSRNVLSREKSTELIVNQDCLEDLFSILSSKSRLRDNPYPQQFRAAYSNTIIDKLFVLSTSANFALDADKILLDISNVTIQ